LTGLAIALAVLVGVSLGALGGGGSILAVPILVYVAGLDAHRAVAASLLIVGVTSVVAAIPHARAGRVRWRTGLIVGLAAMLGAYIGGRLAASVPDLILLSAFAVMMLSTAAAMIRGRRTPDPASPTRELNLILALFTGLGVGLATGFVGAGGGFLIVPALVLIGGLAMPEAIGTSLMVIVLQSGAGLAGHLVGTSLPWGFLLAFTATAVLGSLVGNRISTAIPQKALRTTFGWFVLAMGTLVLVQQLPHPLPERILPWLLLSAVVAGAALWVATQSRRTARP
jgi:hypothetical protein